MSCSVCIHDNLNYIIHDKLYTIIKLPVVFLIHKMLAIFIYVAFHDPLLLFRTINLWANIASLILSLSYVCPSPDCCDKLFEQFNSFADSAKRKAAVWPLEMMLLVLCPVSGYHGAIWCHNCQTRGSGKNRVVLLFR